MKKSHLIQKILHHDLNTIFVNKEQVERVLEIFEDLELLPPFTDKTTNKTEEAAK